MGRLDIVPIVLHRGTPDRANGKRIARIDKTVCPVGWKLYAKAD
jgi:hypothetical protein